MSSGNVNRPTKNERRQQAREQAKQMRDQQMKKEKRNRLFLQGGILAAIVAVAVIVVLVIAQNTKPEGPGPLNMASGGAIFEENFTVAASPAIRATDEPVVEAPDRNALPLDIVIYADYSCSHCGEFEQQNKTVLDDLVASGTATIELRPITMLSEYSVRAANAFACTVNYAPQFAWKLNSQLLSAEVQPLDRPEGLTNDELIEQISLAGANTSGDITRCVNDEEFSGFVQAMSNRALAGPLPNLADNVNLPGVQGTPTVIVNGTPWDPVKYPVFSDFVYIIQTEVENKAPATEPAQ